MSRVLSQDCLSGMRRLKPESVDLAYFDPPFFTGKSHAGVNRHGDQHYRFDDVWPNKAAYIDFITERVGEAVRLLKPTGSLFFHCDHHATHIARSILDDMMGPENFQSEVIWSYKRWSNTKKGLLAQHQTLLFYSRSAAFKWNEQRTDYSPTTNVDQILQQRERDDRNKVVYKRDAAGEVVYETGGKKGVPLGDVWEIPFLNPKAKERTGYPTQKPLELLERIVDLTTDVGDWVLDPFCGSGTTIVAAATNQRRYIGFDISDEAIRLTKERLAKPVRSPSQLLAKGTVAYVSQDPWVESFLVGFKHDRVHRNNGIDAILRTPFDGRLVCLRVQRCDESLLQAVAAGQAAMKKRPGCTLAIIQTAPSVSPLQESNIIVLRSPAVLLAQAVSRPAAEPVKLRAVR